MSLIIRRNGATRFLFRFIESGLALLLFPLVFVSVRSAQESEAHQAQAVTPLAQLLQEAEQNNPQVQAARHGWKGAQQAPTQVSTLPDPQFQVQQFSVGTRARSQDIRTAISLTSVWASPRSFHIPESFDSKARSRNAMPTFRCNSMNPFAVPSLLK